MPYKWVRQRCCYEIQMLIKKLLSSDKKIIHAPRWLYQCKSRLYTGLLQIVFDSRCNTDAEVLCFLVRFRIFRYWLQVFWRKHLVKIVGKQYVITQAIQNAGSWSPKNSSWRKCSALAVTCDNWICPDCIRVWKNGNMIYIGLYNQYLCHQNINPAIMPSLTL